MKTQGTQEWKELVAMMRLLLRNGWHHKDLAIAAREADEHLDQFGGDPPDPPPGFEGEIAHWRQTWLAQRTDVWVRWYTSGDVTVFPGNRSLREAEGQRVGAAAVFDYGQRVVRPEQPGNVGVVEAFMVRTKYSDPMIVTPRCTLCHMPTSPGDEIYVKVADAGYFDLVGSSCCRDEWPPALAGDGG